MEILIKRLHEAATLPAYDRAAGPGIDVFALHDTALPVGECVTVQTGIALALPVGYVGLIWSRHNMTIKHPIKVTADRVDSGYREEVQVELCNTGHEPTTVTAGTPIAQILLQKVDHAQLIEAEDLGVSE